MSERATFAIRGRNPDILTCIANLSNDEVFTPPEFANRMLDSLAEAWAASNGGADIWSDRTVRFLDPCTKSGVFLREIAKRLNKGLSAQLPDLQARVNHILTRQLFGIAITQLTSLLARRSVYCSKHAKGEHSIAKGLAKDEGNIWFERAEHSWINDRCKYCSASKRTLDRGEGRETHAYAFIHSNDVKSEVAKWFGGDMQFDVIIGNPPYQLSGGETSDNPIYQLFVEQAFRLEPRYLTMVTPSRWFTGGKGLDKYRERMIANRQLRRLVDFPNSMESFPGVEIKGGVSYFLWDREFEGDCEFATASGSSMASSAKRDLRDGRGVVIRDNRASAIIDKITGHPGPWLSERVSPQTPFGLYTNFRDWRPKKRNGDIQLFRRGLEEAWTSPEYVTSRREWIPKIKVIMSYAYNGGDALPHQVTGRPIVIPGNSVVTQTYTVAGVFDNLEEAENYCGYLRTRLVRFLIRQRKISQHNRPDTFAFVPDLPVDRRWTDADLYEKFSISAEEQAYVESIIKPMPTDAAVDDEA